MGNSFVGSDDEDIIITPPSDLSSSDSDTEAADDAIEQNEIQSEVQVEMEDEYQLPRKQKFANLDEVTNLNNYEALPPQNDETFEYSNAKKTFVMTWGTINEFNPRNAGRMPKRNVMQSRTGPSPVARRVTNPLESFSLFITDEMLQTIVHLTNVGIEQFRQRFQEVIDGSDKYTYYNPIDLVELRAYIGILYLRGAKKQNLSCGNVIWYHESALDIFAATMSKQRFQFLSRFIEFDDKTNRAERWKFDKFACIRDFFEEVNKRNAKMRRPSAYLAIDETLYPYRGHIGFKQYNPSKPAKYGLLYRSLCDASIPYTYFTLPYAGKPDEMCEESMKYYVTGTDEYTKYLVNNFSNYNSIIGCNISMDRYFTSVTIARWALEKGFTIVGTMRLDRKGIPNGIKTMINRDEKSTFYAYAQN